MRKILSYFILVFLSVTMGCVTLFKPMAWLEGTWEMRKPNGTSRLEIWKQKDHRTLTGEGLKVSGNDTTLLESIQLYQEEKTNIIWYVPTVPDQNQAKPVPFKLVRNEKYSFTFENPDHDFPQRIVYHFIPTQTDGDFIMSTGDSLRIRVESMDGEGINFQFIRK
jgi:hypothetical protein